MAFRAFDLYIPELGIRDIQFLPSSSNHFRFALIYEYHGQRQLKIYSLDVSNRMLKEVCSPIDLPDTTCSIIPCKC